MASKHLSRRSCAFCRARKIKCSNETICEACRRQGTDCIYDFELPRPKAGTISPDSSQPGSAMRDDGFSSRQGSSTNDALPYSGPFRTISAELREDVDNVAEVLNKSFMRHFLQIMAQGLVHGKEILQTTTTLSGTQFQNVRRPRLPSSTQKMSSTPGS